MSLSFSSPNCSVSEEVSVSLVSYRRVGGFLRFVSLHGKIVGTASSFRALFFEEKFLYLCGVKCFEQTFVLPVTLK